MSSLSEMTVLSRRGDRLLPSLGLSLLLAGLLLVGRDQGAGVESLGLAGAGGAVAMVHLFPRLVRALRAHRELLLLLVAVILMVVWAVVGIDRLHDEFGGLTVVAPGATLGIFDQLYPQYFQGLGWPWDVGRTPLLIPVLSALAAGGGLVLLADAVRIRLGFAAVARTPWRLLSGERSQPVEVAGRAISGVVLVAVAAALVIGYAQAYAEDDPTQRLVIVVLAGLWAVAMIAGPPLIGVWLVLDRDEAGRAREEERLRFAAHLHDSVLQTLALIQRQARDPAAVSRLARRQEHALRAWMAGQIDLAAESLAAGLREVVEEIELEYGLVVEATVLGDRGLDPAGEAMVAAVREALRNVIAHAPDSHVTLFAQIEGNGAEVFVRDDGPGFEPDRVAAERRGIRDAIIGRMTSVGGRAVVESAPGEGTEVILRLS